MAVYLGTSGFIQLSRLGDGAFFSTLDAGDVDVSTKRFSFDFPNGTFITGDRLSIARVNANGSASSGLLDFVAAAGWGDSAQHSDGTWYVNVDAIGGLRLYQTWADALAGTASKALALQTPATSYRIRVDLVDTKPHCLGQVLDYSMSTERDSVDVTSLGDSFRERVSGLISGSGQIRALWDWVPTTCETDELELSQYLHQLILRQQLGSEFHADLYVKAPGATPINGHLSGAGAASSIYYSVNAVVTNVSIAFNSSRPLESIVQFVTTGSVQLLFGVPSAYLILQEDGSRMKLEAEDGFLAQESDL